MENTIDDEPKKKVGRPKIRTEEQKKEQNRRAAEVHYSKHHEEVNEKSRRRQLVAKGIDPDTYVRQQCSYIKQDGSRCIRTSFQHMCSRHRPKVAQE